MRGALVLALLAAACPLRPASMPPAADAPLLPLPPLTAACSTPAHPTADDVCPSMFTADGHACVRCPDQRRCVDVDLQIYCVTTCADLTCRVRNDTAPATRITK